MAVGKLHILMPIVNAILIFYAVNFNHYVGWNVVVAELGLTFNTLPNLNVCIILILDLL